MSSSNCYTISKPQIVREQFDEEVVIVDLDTGSYYSLAGAGGEVWSALENGASQAAIVSRLTEKYDGERAEIEASVGRLLQELQQEELIAPQPAQQPAPESDAVATVQGATTPQPEASVACAPWEAPVLQKFTDMQALLLLDPIHEVDSAGWPMPRPEEPVMSEHRSA